MMIDPLGDPRDIVVPDGAEVTSAIFYRLVWPV